MSLQTRFRYFTKAVISLSKEYDRDFQIYTLAYPNKEVRKGFIESLMPAYVHLPARENTFYVVSFIKDLRVGNLDQCMEADQIIFRLYPQ